MPLYTYTCADCGDEMELLVLFDERNRARLHSEEVEKSSCGGALARAGVERINVVSPGYEPGAVMLDGSVVKGHFGKEARKKGKGSYRP